MGVRAMMMICDTIWMDGWSQQAQLQMQLVVKAAGHMLWMSGTGAAHYVAGTASHVMLAFGCRLCVIQA